MFSHEVQLGAIKLVAQSLEGLNSELFHITVAFAAFLVLVFAAEYINEKFQARRLEAFADTADTTTVQEDNMISNSNSNSNTPFNVFDALRSVGYNMVDFLVAIPELGWVVGKELVVEGASFGWWALKGLLSGIKLVGMIAIFSLIVGLAFPVVMLVATVITAKDTVVSGYRKVTGWFAAKKQERADRIAAAKAEAEAERVEALKADAKLIGMVTINELGAVVKLAVAEALAAQSGSKVVNLAALVTNAQAVVMKSVDEMNLAEMREELGVKGFNTRQLRAKVRAARANANS